MTKLHITLKIKPLKKAFFFKKRQHYRKDTNVPPNRRSGFAILQIRNDSNDSSARGWYVILFLSDKFLEKQFLKK
jgi:hypothetical protein